MLVHLSWLLSKLICEILTLVAYVYQVVSGMNYRLTYHCTDGVSIAYHYIL